MDEKYYYKRYLGRFMCCELAAIILFIMLIIFSVSSDDVAVTLSQSERFTYYTTLNQSMHLEYEEKISKSDYE